jgi:chemotaxis protein histidine kinase CheA/ActR/RegA family two-component response regulator
MSADREALLERFRAGLLARIERIDSLLEQTGENGSVDELRKEALGELHTLKGEARMLGLGSLADVAHSLETFLGQDGSSASALRTLDAMRKALAPGVAREIADVVLEAARLELGELPGSTETALSTSAEPSQVELEASAAAEQKAGKNRRYVQVDAGAVDDLCERLAELSALYGKLRGRTLGLLSTLAGGTRANAELIEDLARVSAVVTDSTTRAWSLRLVPVEPMLRELRRHARNLADDANKSIDVNIEARGVELERNVLDTLWDSLLHLVQNAVDHGLEADRTGAKSGGGSITLSAHAAGPNVVLCVEDNGRGIDPERLRAAAGRSGRGAELAQASEEELFELLFDHGFSTRTEVSRLSGRGVGLAVVRRQVEALGGQVRVESKLGQGTRFFLTVPFTVTKERSLIVRVGAALYAFPARSVRAVLGSHEILSPKNERRPTLRYADRTLPLVSLARALDLKSDTPDASAVVVELGGRPFALTVPLVVGDLELIRRPAEALLGSLTGIAATALLDDGRLVMMLDVAFLQRALREASQGPAASPNVSVRPGPRRRRVLIADDSPVVTQLMQEILVSAGYLVEVTKDGSEALASIRVSEPDLVVSDLEMPRMGGFELLAEIRAKNQRLPFILLTTRGSVEDRRRASELGANAYLLKTGFKSDALLDLVRRFLPSPAAEHASPP